MLSNAELARMQSVVISALDQIVSVNRTTRVSDGQQGFTESWPGSTVYSAIPCRFKRLPSIEGVVAEQIAGKLRLQMLFPQSYTLQHKDRVTDKLGNIYQLLSNPAGMSYAFLLSVEIEQIEEQG